MGWASSGSAWWRIASSRIRIPRTRPQVVKPNQEDAVAAAVFGDLQQLLDALKPGLAREIVGDGFERDRLNRIHHDVPLVHRIAACNLDMRPLPDPYGASHAAAPNLFAKVFGKY